MAFCRQVEDAVDVLMVGVVGQAQIMAAKKGRRAAAGISALLRSDRW